AAAAARAAARGGRRGRRRSPEIAHRGAATSGDEEEDHHGRSVSAHGRPGSTPGAGAKSVTSEAPPRAECAIRRVRPTDAPDVTFLAVPVAVTSIVRVVEVQ